MDTMTPITAFQAAKKRNITENMQMHGGAGLMRYNSAPSSVLAGFLHIQDFFDEPIPHVDDVSELTRLLSPAIADEFCMSNTLLNVNPAEGAKGCGTAYESCSVNIPQNTRSTANITSGGLVDPNRTATQCPPFGCHKLTTAGHLSSIFEHTQDDLCSTVQKTQLDMGNYANSEFSAPKPAMPISVSTSFGQPLLATTTKTSLIRHSSFPAEILSRLGMEKCSESPMPRYTRDTHRQAMSSESMPHVVTHIPHGLRRGTHISHENISSTHFPLGQLESGRPFPANGSSFPGIQNSFNVTDDRSVVIGKTRSMELSPSSTQTSLFRQSSSPAGLLSQLSFDGTASASCEMVLPFLSSGSSSEEDRKGGVSRFLSRISGFWEEAGSGMSQRKRGRDTEGKIDDGLRVPIHKCSVEEEALQWSSGGHMETSSGSLLSMDDSVLCRTRAKRGCATHPRSIAERVRRTKISEGMRKLQELVPNMEKQTNTATMLDEAVEYVKFLQQQVQMLSESQAKCNGMCHLKGNT